MLAMYMVGIQYVAVCRQKFNVLATHKGACFMLAVYLAAQFQLPMHGRYLVSVCYMRESEILKENISPPPKVTHVPT